MATVRNTKFSEVKVGEYFLYEGKEWRRVDFYGFINNSSIIKNVRDRGDGFAVKTETGIVASWRRDAEVQVLGEYSSFGLIY